MVNMECVCVRVCKCVRCRLKFKEDLENNTKSVIKGREKASFN